MFGKRNKGISKSQNISIIFEDNNTKRDNLFFQLFETSNEHYKQITSSNGRFSYFECNDKLFPSARPIQSKYVRENSTEISNISKFYLEDGHLLLVGEGGIGKTTSLLKAWKDLLENFNKYCVIPFYVPLNEANVFSDSNFIENYITTTYNIKISDLNSIPANASIMFLLDGFNEISDRTNQIEIAREIKQICKRRGFRVIMTSRFDFINTYGFENVQKYIIMPLDESVIEDYLKSEGIYQTDIPFSVISNPMMLTLYTNLCHIKDNISETIVLPFCDNNTQGELLSNFIYCQIGKSFSIEKISNTYLSYCALLLVSPFIAYSIETEGKFTFSYSHVRDIVKSAFDFYSDSDVDFFVKRDLFSLSIYNPFTLQRDGNTVTTIIKILMEDLAIIQSDGLNLSFRHQYFRDFFSAQFILNDIYKSLNLGKLPVTMSERTLPEYITVFIGDCAHEYKNIGKNNVDSVICRLMSLARDKSTDELKMLLNNIVDVLKLSRHNNLTAVSFEGLDLTNLSLNGITFSDKNKFSNFDNTKIASRTFLLQGHLGQVRSAVYDSTMRIILSAGDTSVKEWDSLTGLCVCNYLGHSNLVNSACFHPDESKILSAANDNTVREWDRKTGKCLHVFSDHKGYVTKAIYDATGDTVYSCSWDGTVLRYDRDGDNWKGPRLIAKHDKNIKSISLSADGKNILTASGDGTVKEWDSECNVVRIFTGHSDMVNSVALSANGRYVLSGGYDKSVIVFDRFSGRIIWRSKDINYWVRNVCFSESADAVFVAVHNGNILEYAFNPANGCQLVSQYLGHNKAATSISVSDDESKIISTSEDGTIREWDRKSKQCIRVYNGIEFSTTDTVYSSDGLLVLTIKDDEFTIAKRTDGIAYYHSPKCSSTITSAVFAEGDNSVLFADNDGLFLLDINSNHLEPIVESKKENCSVKYVKYDEDKNRIISIGKNFNNQTVIFFVDDQKILHKYNLSVNADYVDFKTNSEFVTFSSGGIIRIWDLKNGAQKGVLGVNVENSSFINCNFTDSVIMEVIKEAGGVTT